MGIGLGCCLALFHAPKASAATAVLAPGISAGAGANSAYRIEAACLRTDDAVTTVGDLNWGGATQLQLGRCYHQVNRIVCRFDLRSLRNRASHVTGARLKLTVRSSQVDGNLTSFPMPLQLTLYRISGANGDWIAGTADNQAQSGSVCWNWRRAFVAPWVGQAGCGLSGTDSDSEPVAVAEKGAALYYPEDAWTLEFVQADWLQDWIDHPEHNAGFLIKAEMLEATASDGVMLLRFHSDESTTVPARPRLEVDYDPAMMDASSNAADAAWLGVR
jgi:hypothetical protein